MVNFAFRVNDFLAQLIEVGLSICSVFYGKMVKNSSFIIWGGHQMGLLRIDVCVCYDFNTYFLSS